MYASSGGIQPQLSSARLHQRHSPGSSAGIGDGSAALSTPLLSSCHRPAPISTTRNVSITSMSTTASCTTARRRSTMSTSCSLTSRSNSSSATTTHIAPEGGVPSSWLSPPPSTSITATTTTTDDLDGGFYDDDDHTDTTMTASEMRNAMVMTFSTPMDLASYHHPNNDEEEDASSFVDEAADGWNLDTLIAETSARWKQQLRDSLTGVGGTSHPVSREGLSPGWQHQQQQPTPPPQRQFVGPSPSTATMIVHDDPNDEFHAQQQYKLQRRILQQQRREIAMLRAQLAAAAVTESTAPPPQPVPTIASPSGTTLRPPLSASVPHHIILKISPPMGNSSTTNEIDAISVMDDDLTLDL